MSTIARPAEPRLVPHTLRPMERAGREVVHRVLGSLVHGRVTLVDGPLVRVGGRADPGAVEGHAALDVRVEVRDPRFYTSVAFHGSVGVAESYMEGHWECDDLPGLFELLLMNRDALASVETPMARAARPIARALHALRRNTRSGSRRNIHAHYDLSNEFFALWLDPTMMYSSAIFEPASLTLEEAQVEKVDRCCRKLELRASDHLLEIGTGWGGAAIHAASRYGCRVTTTTISDEQFAMASARVREAGLSERVTIVKSDYRDLTGTFDKVLSIEMIEAVGHEYLPAYFGAISRLLKPDGLAVIQGIYIRDQRYDQARATIDFLKKYIFPGSCLIGMAAVTRAIKERTDLSLVHVEDLGVHYVRTLACWNEEFHARLDEVRRMGFDERFIRMWRYYFTYCMGAFRARHCGDYQLVLAKPLARPSAPIGVRRMDGI
jgi:cyclopropane-fatty-acyl-phospholipid synthase